MSKTSAALQEPLYESERTRISRRRQAPAAEDRVVCKEFLGPQGAERSRHERRILERLAGMAGVPQLAAQPAADDVLLLQEPEAFAGARPLSGLRPEVAELTDIALQLAGILAELHRRGVVHRDVNPANILRSPSGHVMLIDFDLATTFTQERLGFVAPNQIAGTLAYMAPEQTGRTGRSVDARADLWGLGAMLYELATGRLPFADLDPLELIRDLLARAPVAPIRLQPALPQALSDIIMRLLEKEPDRRYQSAEGLQYDLMLMRDSLTSDAPEPLVLATRDFPLRLSAPSELIGREAELATLRQGFEDAVGGRSQVLLVAGAPGVGKTALINELRPLVAAHHGWFVSGKFDQYRQDVASDAVRQALEALCRLMMAEPEAELVALRSRLLAALGTNAGLAAAVQPLLTRLLDAQPEAPEAAIEFNSALEERLIQCAMALLRSSASAERPLVIFIDDLQWAAATPLGLFEAVLLDPTLRGVLLVGAYRDAELTAGQPLTQKLQRWQRLGHTPLLLHLDNLPQQQLDALVGRMLRLPPARASALSRLIAERTDGNPYDTVELLAGLRQDAALVPDQGGWRWDENAIRRFVGQGNVLDALAARIARLPASAIALLETLACLGGEVSYELLQAASGLSEAELERQLLPALEDGVLTPAEHGALRFAHDRVQQAAYARQPAIDRQQTHLRLARRLATLPVHAPAAAEQYLAAGDALTDAQEWRRAAALLQAGAAHAQLLANHVRVERYLDAALQLLLRLPQADDSLIAPLQAGRHAALYNLGRLDDADGVFATLAPLGAEPCAWDEAACVQVSSLTNRGRIPDALALGRQALLRLGLPVPPPESLPGAIEAGLKRIYYWSNREPPATAEMSDRRVLATARMINRLMPPSFFGDQVMMAWLATEAHRLWTDYGPCAALIGPLAHVPFVMMALRQDYRTGDRVTRRVLAYGEARGYEPETSQARFLFSLGSGHWSGSLEDNLQQAQRAHEGLMRGGDLQNACFTYYVSIQIIFDCAPRFESALADAQAGLAFAARTGNDQAAAAYLAWRQLCRSLAGSTTAPGSFDDADFEQARYLQGLALNPTAAANFHIARAISAAIFGHTDDLLIHAAAAMPLLPYIQSTPGTATAHLLQALACAERTRSGPVGQRAEAAMELDRCVDFLADRAADAPANFLHLSLLAQAERAWSRGDTWAAARAFDGALHEALARSRVWHRALIAERASAFHLEQGLTHRSRQLLAEAYREYRAWGAAAKLAELERGHPLLQSMHQAGPTRSSHGPHSGSYSQTTDEGSVSVDSIDMLAVLRVSQALSSETSMARLRLRLDEALGAMTGASGVQLVMRSEASSGWALVRATDRGADMLALDEPEALALLPLSALRYTERSGATLLVEDATRDDRFAHDPYLATLQRCSLLIVPVLMQGVMRAMLVLENRLSSAAFSAWRLDAVQLVAGQLAVSLENALLYASLERKVIERTQALESANLRLETLSLTDELTGLPNRRRFTETLECEWRRALRMRRSLGIAMIDVDHFKRYNDLYGHPAGDVCLSGVAAALAGSVRQGIDLAARYGGEEFALILPDAEMHMALPLAERSRAAVAALAKIHGGADRGIVTVSIGIAVLVPAEDQTAARLVSLADAALYEAKRQGRDRVVVAPS
ncbi:MAG: diguanylate cyclase protein [Hydrocarboniphaga sp.]|uniref:diguanylate cyclase n=1 Tax=Hydrocarboniphaga sp. TaxID=2033016 RepID=UPI00261E0D07|nr:diguanylate cyclase [Hydrocarboniphaga sp.]MDB5972707.1 diguanylate cyclase protein [Hydrocarboniphaga sp.]